MSLRRCLLIVGTLCFGFSACTEDKVPDEGRIVGEQQARAAADIQGATKAEQLDAVFTRAMEENGFMGHVIVTHHGELMFAKGYGFADIEAGLEHGIDVPFPIASVTKQWTSAVVFLLAQRGVIDLDNTANQYLGETCPLPQGSATLRQLMSHTSGLVRDDEFNRAITDTGILYGPAAPFAAFVCSLPQSDDPGTEFYYKNTDTMVLQAVLEQVTGKPFAELLAEELHEPLGMTASGMVAAAIRPDGMMVGYVRDGETYEREDYPLYVTAAGGGLSTPRDMAIWNNAIIEAPLFDSIRDEWLRGDGAIGYAGAGHWVFPYSTGEGEWLMTVERQGHIGAIHNANIVRPQDGYTFNLVSNVGGVDMNNIYNQRGLAYETIRILLSENTSTPE
ncbi:beta-lactamase family protein [Parvularcula flava]|uniref:Beta-lactamase family protein n=1 Tax=Aquisalinus luteolus TaxID=1566827 RepID=A0A8J3ERM4_9PROT|nr:serine hydrolase domain-containing protein [Aquisalinus luteolus]NHK28297.1 beta-lactamase family protein [Aquisalinus luteolus]GGH98054.1 hypothetical protein GCM10011355_20740 [Aquisalinus luteolus]